MTTEVIITGTGTPTPLPDRAGSGVLIRHGDVSLQFDAGRSTVARLAAAGTTPGDLTAFFATHHHSDHLTGLQDIVLTRWVTDARSAFPPLPIVVPAGPLERFVRRMLDPWEDDIRDRAAHSGRGGSPSVDVRPFTATSDPTEVWSDGDVRVLSCLVDHEPIEPAVGYRVETPDGVVAISGDTTICDGVAALAAGADVLVHEVIDVEQLPPFLRWIGSCHSDPAGVGGLAAAAGVGTVMLTHLIPAPVTQDEVARFELGVASGGFGGEIIVAEDLTAVTLG